MSDFVETPSSDEYMIARSINKKWVADITIELTHNKEKYFVDILILGEDFYRKFMFDTLEEAQELYNKIVN